jgi:type II secretory pathway component PulF
MLAFHAPVGTAHRAHFYSQLSTLLGAGLPVLQALEQIGRHPPSAGVGPSSFHLLGSLRRGLTFTDAFALLPGGTPDFDLALIAAGERSGRLDQTFALLARHLGEHVDNVRRMIQEAAYPILVLHLAAFVAPLPMLVRTGSVVRYVAGVLGPLAIAYGLLGLLAWSFRRDSSPRWRALIERILVRVPVVGSARADLALARLAGALEAQLSAGILVTEAWPAAAAASGSPLLRRVVGDWAPHFEHGHTPGELVRGSAAFPELFSSSYAAGEISGRIEPELRRLARHHEDEGFRKLRMVSQWAPRIFYGFIALWMVGQILVIAGGYAAVLHQFLEE